MKLALPYAVAALALLGLGIWLENECLAEAAAVGAAHAACLIRRSVISSERTGQPPD